MQSCLTHLRIILIAVTGLAVLIAARVPAADEFADERADMVDTVSAYTSRTSKYLHARPFSDDVLKVMGDIPRHLFVPEDLRPVAYSNRPLPIGFGQTISQPYIVALMTDLLMPRPEHRVLEIGTGSGYQAAMLSRLVKDVYSIEIIQALSERSTALLEKIGYHNVHTRVADGYYGWEEHAPFDGIIVTAAISHIPPPLVAQLKNGGKMVIPVGTRFQVQQLTLVEKDADGKLSMKQLLPVQFVPFTGGH